MSPKNPELFENGVSKSWECLQKISERYLIQNWSYKQTKLVETYERMERRTDKRIQPLLELTPQGGELIYFTGLYLNFQ